MHRPVLLNEVVKYLDPKQGEIVLDATINGGGHATAIVQKILPNGKLIGIDQDVEVLEKLKSKLNNAILINGNFRDLDKLLKGVGIQHVNKVLFDLGMSSHQLEESGRGFSFQKDEPLDMRFNKMAEGIKAKDIITGFSEKELVDILKKYGEERFASSIAQKIIEIRKIKPIETTFELVDVISKAVPEWYRRGRRHFATKTFQALRITVNDEMESIKGGIDKAWKLLAPEGRLVVISFHSLEDRIIKNFFREIKTSKKGNLLTKKPVVASLGELRTNPRARSAKLRAIVKI